MSETLMVQLPESLLRQVEKLAAETGVTAEAFVAAAAAEKAAIAVPFEEYLSQRRARARREWLDAFFNRPNSPPPVPGDELD